MCLPRDKLGYSISFNFAEMMQGGKGKKSELAVSVAVESPIKMSSVEAALMSSIRSEKWGDDSQSALAELLDRLPLEDGSVSTPSPCWAESLEACESWLLERGVVGAGVDWSLRRMGDDRGTALVACKDYMVYVNFVSILFHHVFI